MSDDPPISFAARRAHRTRDCRDWTVLNALRDAIADVESGAIKADAVYVAFVVRNDDGTTGYPYTAAGLSRLETAGTLAMHLADNSK